MTHGWESLPSSRASGRVLAGGTRSARGQEGWELHWCLETVKPLGPSLADITCPLSVPQTSLALARAHRLGQQQLCYSSCAIPNPRAEHCRINSSKSCPNPSPPHFQLAWPPARPGHKAGGQTQQWGSHKQLPDITLPTLLLSTPAPLRALARTMSSILNAICSALPS